MVTKKRGPKRTRDQVRLDRTEIMRLYLEHKPQTEIAQIFGVSRTQIGYDIKRIREAWKKSSVIDFDEKKRIELDRIDVLERNAWEAWERSQKETVTKKAGKDSSIVTQTSAGNPRFLEIVIKCIERRCRIFGIDAPIKTEIEDITPIQYIAVPEECENVEGWLGNIGNDRNSITSN